MEALHEPHTRSSRATGRCNKPIADAEAFIGALLPKVAAVQRRRDRHLPVLSGAAGAGRLGARLAGGVYAQNMHEADSGAFTGEVSAPMLAEIDAGA